MGFVELQDLGTGGHCPFNIAPCFEDKESETQRGQVTCLSS